jgi:hypothetical protein
MANEKAIELVVSSYSSNFFFSEDALHISLRGRYIYNCSQSRLHKDKTERKKGKQHERTPKQEQETKGRPNTRMKHRLSRSQRAQNPSVTHWEPSSLMKLNNCTGFMAEWPASNTYVLHSFQINHHTNTTIVSKPLRRDSGTLLWLVIHHAPSSASFPGCTC